MAKVATFHFPDKKYRHPPVLAYRVWLSGGQVAFYGTDIKRLDHSHGLSDFVFASLEHLQLEKLFSCLSRCGLPIIGITSYQFQDELAGRHVPLFLAWHDTEYWWCAKQARDRWQMVSYGAKVVGQEHLANLADRIACAIDEGETHLGNLCRAYATQLGMQDADTWSVVAFPIPIRKQYTQPFIASSGN